MDTGMENGRKKRGLTVLKAVGAGAMAVCLIASLGLNIYQAAVSDRKTAGFVDYILERIAEEEKQENEYIEDGYKVGGEYEIRSTTHISDAYLSGDGSGLSGEDRETLDMAAAVLDEVIEDGMTDYEKEEAVYLWMTENIGQGRGGYISRPGMRRSAFTPHDVLTGRSAVCVGYATTFRLFMNMLGLDCRIVHNDYHSWDLVKLGGDWYHVDIYSDAGGALYGNFNMTDDVARNGHSWDESALPEAKSTKYTPAVQKAVELESVLNVPAAMSEALDGGSAALFYKFKEPLTDEDMETADYMASLLDMVFSGGMLEDGEGYYFQAAWYPAEREGDFILGLRLESYGSGEPDFDTDPPEARQIARAVAEAFGLDPALLGVDPLPGAESDEAGGAG